MTGGYPNVAPVEYRDRSDLTVTVILLVMGLLGIGLTLIVAMFFAMMGAACNDASCNRDLMSAAWYVAMFAPPAVYGVSLVWAIVRLRRRRKSWWVALIGLVGPSAICGASIVTMNIGLG